MPKVIDQNPKSSTFGLLIEQPVSQAQVTDPWGENRTVTYGAVNPATGQQFQTASPSPSVPRVQVGMVDTGSAVQQINKQKSYLDTTYPVITQTQQPPAGWDAQTYQNFKTANPGLEPDAQDTAMMQSAGTATYTNANGQEATYTQEQLQDPNIKNFLASNGYVLTKSNGVNPDGSTQLQSSYNQAASDVENLTKEFLSYNVDQDPAFQAQAQNIRDKFARLKAEMEKTNFQRQRAFETLGLRSGTSQYAGGIQMGIEGEELNQANQRIGDLTQQEAEAISAARTAFETGKYQQFNAKVTALKDIRDQKAKALEDYNKKLADAITNQREQNKFEFEVYKFQQEQKSKANEGNKPMVVAAGSSIYDPSTGEFIGTAPKPVDTSAPELGKWGGMVHQWNPTTQKWETLGSEEDYGGEDSNMVLDWANQVASGARKFSDVPENLKNAVNSAIAKLPPKQENIKEVQQKIDVLNNIYNGNGYQLTKAVGANWLARTKFNPLSFDDKAQKNRLIATVEQLVGQEALDKLIAAKANGATFGALSEGELNLLKDSSTKFGNWARDTNGDGKTDYYEIDEKSFKEEINRVKMAYEDLIKNTSQQNNSTGTLQQAVDDYYNKNPDKRALIDSLDASKNPATGQPYTDEEKKQIYKAMGISFDQPLSMGVNGSQLGNLSSTFESSGDPGAIGYDSTGGLSYGIYQLAHNNAQVFISQSPYKSDFAGLKFNSPQWQRQWKEVAKRDPEGFKQAQQDYIEKTHFEPQVNKLAKAGIDLSQYSPVLQDVVFSTAVQHGANTDVVEKAIKKVGKNATEAQIIKAIYNERWSGGRRFSSSTQAVKNSVYNRFFGKNGELAKALNMLNSSYTNVG